MFDTIWLKAAAILAFYHLAGPLAVKSTFRFSARCSPKLTSLEDLPAVVSGHIAPRIAELEELGFALIGCYDCGTLTTHTQSYIGYFCNRATNNFANVSVVVAPRQVASYVEFSTRFANGFVLETNTNSRLPLTPVNPEIRVFRFPQITGLAALYQVHRRLMEKYAEGLRAQGEPQGREIHRLVRVLENYGPRQVNIGYMVLEGGGEFYRLTWKGAFLMAWHGMWPTSMIRKALAHQAMSAELQSLEAHGSVVLQKA